MSKAFKCLSIMVLTEDSGSDGPKTVIKLLIEMFKQIDQSVQSHRIGFTPLEDAYAQLAVRGNEWKNAKASGERNRRAMIRSIINELLRENSFVFYHIDGDCRWSAHESSTNVSQFRDLMLPPIHAGLMSDLRGKTLQEYLGRFHLLVPCYSIEAWLYQNTREARRLCQEEGCGTCVSKLSDWEQDRASLDEVDQPKKQLCFQDRHNQHLATSGFPTGEVFSANASFAKTVMDLVDSAPLTAALARTHAEPEPAPH